MTAFLKEETTIDNQTKSYLQMYEEYICGYQQYKMEQAAVCAKTAKANVSRNDTNLNKH